MSTTITASSATTPIIAPASPKKVLSGDVETTINYQPVEVDGELNTVIPGTAGSYRRKFDPQPVTVHDIRGREQEFTLEKQGFQVYRHTSAEKLFEDKDAIKNVMYPEVEALLKETTGASHVHIFSHIVRRTPWEQIQKEIEERQLGDDQRVGKVGPAHFAHVDQGPLGAQQLFNESLTEEQAARLGKTRWGIINVWRPIKPVQKNPLAVCDMRTTPPEDLSPVYTRAPRDYGSYTAAKMATSYQSLASSYNPEHKWYYASGMTPDEVLMIKIFDTAKAADGSLQRVLHSAFTHPEFEGCEPRESIETRCLVFWEQEEQVEEVAVERGK